MVLPAVHRIFHWFLGWSQMASFGLLIAFLAVNFIYVFRISRLMWINVNVKARPNAIEKYGKKCDPILQHKFRAASRDCA